ncbi:hypothetical protein GCM10025883_40760 [Mobilicoccus caccae]|uniref:Uncharacterized protein n=1 Tax=Mobilicoccus caccae TaxID=1859295 RepID=A0ABQ6IY85_9MICO|nr:iron chelate uptake ABC transporter family permease subunit [Mobilicoccus caccae]GMA42031.1 hypothetical protein GCM10025883_40760 [Mobilicoccus caccae]
MDTTRHTRAWSGVLLVVIAVVVLVSAAHGPLPTTPVEAGKILLGHLVPGMPWMSDGSITPPQDEAVWSFRLARSLLAALAGAALALAGAILQVTVRNPSRSPTSSGSQQARVSARSPRSSPGRPRWRV